MKHLVLIFMSITLFSYAQSKKIMNTQTLQEQLHLTTGIVKQGSKNTYYTFVTLNEGSPKVVIQRIKNEKLIDEEFVELRIQNDTIMIGNIAYAYKNEGKAYLQPLDNLPQSNEAPIILSKEFLVFDEKGKAYHTLEEIEQQVALHYQGFEKTLHKMLNSMQKHEVTSPEINIQFIGTLRSMRGPCLPLSNGTRIWEQISYFEINKSILGNVAVNAVKIDYEIKELNQLKEGNTYLISLHVSEKKQQQLQQEDTEFWNIDKIQIDEVLRIEQYKD